MPDLIHKPPHYSRGRFGCQCIEVARLMTFDAGNAWKYIWRHLDKGAPVDDLGKAAVYLGWAIDDDRVWLDSAARRQGQDIWVRSVMPFTHGAFVALNHIAIESLSTALDIVKEAGSDPLDYTTQD